MPAQLDDTLVAEVIRATGPEVINMRKTRTNVAVVAVALGLTCASAAGAFGTSDPSRGAQVATSPPSPAPLDLDAIQRNEPGAAPPSRSLPLDVTGTADAQTQIDALSSLLSKEAASDGGLQWDAKNKTVIVRIVASADTPSTALQARKTSILAAAERLIAMGFKVEFRTVKYSRAELEALAVRLFSTVDQWAPGLTTYSSSTEARSGVGGGWDPEKNRVVLVVPEDRSQAWADRVRALKDDRITVKTYKPAPDGIRSRRASGQLRTLPQQIAAPGNCDSTPCRVDDWGPPHGSGVNDKWSGGIWLSPDRYKAPYAGTVYAYFNASCTAGFNWRKGSITYGSTNWHCWVDDEFNWYHNKQHWGSVKFTSPATDTMLMSGANLDFAPWVYVGDQTTNSRRVVVGARTSWTVGDVVALSGANSGLHTSSVKNPSYKDPGDGLTYVLMNTHIGEAGDSGAPMLTTRKIDGQVIAHGMFVGWGPFGVDDGAEFMSVGTIGTKLGATLMVG